jgi:hypothetical protein
MYEDVAIELARTVRECTERAERRIRDRQLGEAWVDLVDLVERRTDEGSERQAT